MKTIKTLLLLLLNILLFSCGDGHDDQFDSNLNQEMLRQTVWKGNYVIYEDRQIPYNCNVTLFFITEEKLEFTETRENFFNKHRISYIADSRLLSIGATSGSPQLSGDWLVTDITKDKLILKKNNGKENYTMTLSRIYKADYSLSTDILKQTIWKGFYTIYDEPGSTPYTCEVSLFFKSEKDVEFTEIRNDFHNQHTTDYAANRNLLSIENNSGSPQLSGDWLITEMGKEKLILKKNLGNDKFNYTMTLSKTN